MYSHLNQELARQRYAELLREADGPRLAPRAVEEKPAVRVSWARRRLALLRLAVRPL
jgi:hypothetical protein